MQGFCVFGPKKTPPAMAPDRCKNGQFGALIRAWRAPIRAPFRQGEVWVSLRSEGSRSWRNSKNAVEY
jgi:hypothetical protein